MACDHGRHLGDTNSWCKCTNFESAARNTLLWRVPGQAKASQGLNTRLTEMVDLFPTLIDLTGLPKIPACEGRDQPPTVQCVQGTSYADEFLPGLAGEPAPKKQYAFTQWPHYNHNFTSNTPFNPGTYPFRMSYTVRSAAGYRYTQYVPYDPIKSHIGNWSACDTEFFGPCEKELYDYNTVCWSEYLCGPCTSPYPPARRSHSVPHSRSSIVFVAGQVGDHQLDRLQGADTCRGGH